MGKHTGFIVQGRPERAPHGTTICRPQLWLGSATRSPFRKAIRYFPVLLRYDRFTAYRSRFRRKNKKRRGALRSEVCFSPPERAPRSSGGVT
jgi:hypothetical protein